MNVNDTWANVLRDLSPDYDHCKEMLDKGPKIVATLKQINLRWRIRIEEDWHNEDGELYYTSDYSNLDERCKWAEEQLKNWRFVVRLSHQEWKFLNRKQAEKFLMMFNLRWAE